MSKKVIFKPFYKSKKMSEQQDTILRKIQSKNYLGKQSSSKNSPKKMEVKRPIYDFKVVDDSIFGKVSESELLINDRFVRHTALCFIPSETIWEPIQEIRQELDSVCI